MRVMAIRTPPTAATAPPLSPVPAPRGTTGRSYLRATLTAAATSWAELGKTTTCGWPFSIVPSYSKTMRSLASLITLRLPSAASSSSMAPRGMALRVMVGNCGLDGDWQTVEMSDGPGGGFASRAYLPRVVYRRFVHLDYKRG